MMRAPGVLLLATLATACLDYGDPVIPNRASPAVLQANLRVFDQGVLQVDGSLSPGRDSLGFLRPVQSPFILAAGLIVEPKTLGERGVRTYQTSVTRPPRATGGPFELVPPSVRDVGALPTVSWGGLVRATPDTLVVVRGQDVVLLMDTVPVQSVPSNFFRQWFLDINAGGQIFRLSGTGLPPLRLRIPSDFIPGNSPSNAGISLIFFQSAQVSSPDRQYIGNIVLDVRLNWFVRFVAP